jgi:hypothetical protein
MPRSPAKSRTSTAASRRFNGPEPLPTCRHRWRERGRRYAVTVYPVPVDWQPDVADIGPPVVQHLRLIGPAGPQHLDGELGVRGDE